MIANSLVRRQFSIGAPICVLCAAFCLRMVALATRPLWYDEAFALLYASLTPDKMWYGTITPSGGAGAADVHPLLYYSILNVWMRLAGSTPFAARYLSVIWGTLVVAVLWQTGQRFLGRRVGVWSGVLAAGSPFLVAYSQEARMYALLGLCAVCAAYGLLRALETQPARGIGCWWMVYVVAAVGTLYAHNLGAFALLGLNVLALARGTWRRRFLSLALADCAVLVLFAPWLIGVLPGQIGFVGRGYWLSEPGIEELVRALMLPVLTFYEPAPVWVLGVGLFAGLLVLVLSILRSVRMRGRGWWFLIAAWVPVGALFAVSQWRPVYLERALLPSALFYLLTLAWLLMDARLPRAIRALVGVLLIVGYSGSLVQHFTYFGFPRPRFEQAVAFLEAEIQPGDRVVHTNKLTYFPMLVYGPQLDGVFLADPAGAPQDTLAYPTQEALGIFATQTLDEALESATRVWLITFEREIAEVERSSGNHYVLEHIQADYQLVDEWHFDDLIIGHYVWHGG